MLSPNELVSAIAQKVAQGITCYVKKQERDYTAADEAEDSELIELASKVKLYPDRYIVVPPMPTQTLIFAMTAFLAEVTDPDIKRELGTCLNRKGPTRNFMQTVNSRFDIKQHWANFMIEKYEAYVGDVFIKDYNY